MKISSNSKLYLLSCLFLALCPLAQAQIINVPTENDFEIEYNKAERVVKLGEGHYFIDFGKAYFGTVVLNSKQLQKDSLIVRLGEKLAESNQIDRNPGGTIRYQQVKLNQLEAKQDVVLNLPADKKNTKPGAIHLPASFGVIMPFRYCELENLQVPIEDLEISQKAFHYQFNDEAGTFTSSDTILNAVWDLCKHTIKATSFTGYYVDGDRERIPYEADAYINQLSHYSCDNVYSMARRTNEYFVQHPTWPTEWLLHTVLLYYQDYMYTGETEMLEKYYDVLKIRTLKDLEREDGLISSKSAKLDGEFKLKLGFKNAKTNVKDIVDWPAGQKDTGWKLARKEGERDGYEMVAINTVVNSFYYYNLFLMSEIADCLGKTKDAAFFQKKSKKLKKVINKKLFDKSRGVYIDGEGSNHASLHANMFPLAFDLVPEKNKKSVSEFIKTRGMACSVYGAQYLLDALFNANESEYALKLITDTTHDRTWWNMIEIGSTMALEAWDMKYKPNSDWNHAWGTAPLNIITRRMWGVTPKTPGFASVQIQPQLADLQSSEIKVPTLKGSIEAKYSVSDKNEQIYEIKLPKGMTGEFVLSNSKTKVLFNNDMIKNKKILKLKEGVNTLRIKQ
ncbi:alpha-L-rhamnosidase C-terminal domain-containing protein [Ancylomarina sp. 16SWW S1-10-2]|uniref:alpha-L-rhamnosidase-related protein n=1 Tax=Ancylomarina sp. 16SWW S1-10-2 TaxID=2499681 RepID=UPI0012ADEF22|nr:alpha-L-rhamnosidase C-terminal domain-containing protein [Ancylomarina sp. 16SWW S1-10-2]MRT93201.1 alpha-L-rhamnosidase [Ancylomarina sp. 16SWW S1-10-2]